MAITETGISSAALIWSAAASAAGSAASTTASGIGKKKQQKRAIRAQKEAAQQQQNWNLENYQRMLEDERANYQMQQQQNRDNLIFENEQNLAQTRNLYDLQREYNSPQAMKELYAAAGFNYVPSAGQTFDVSGASSTSMQGATMNTPSIASAPSYDPSSIYTSLNPYDSISQGMEQAVNIGVQMTNMLKSMNESDNIIAQRSQIEASTAHTKQVTENLVKQAFGIDLDNWIKEQTNPINLELANKHVEEMNLTIARMTTENKMLDFSWQTQPELWRISRDRMLRDLANAEKNGTILDLNANVIRSNLQRMNVYNSEEWLAMEKQLFQQELESIKADVYRKQRENHFDFHVKYSNGTYKDKTPYEMKSMYDINNRVKHYEIEKETLKQMQQHGKYIPKHEELDIEEQEKGIKWRDVNEWRKVFNPYHASINNYMDKFFGVCKLKIDIYNLAKKNYAKQLAKNRRQMATPEFTGSNFSPIG